MVLTAQLLPCKRPAVHADRDGSGRVVMRASVRSAAPHVIAALQADLHAFFQELFEGGLQILLEPLSDYRGRDVFPQQCLGNHMCKDTCSCSWWCRRSCLASHCIGMMHREATNMSDEC